MQRYKAIVAYDGSAYAGYQIQLNGKTVQAVIEKALKKMHKGTEVKITSSGRTDAGVHARGQVFHFDSDIDLPTERWVAALNGLLPKDIALQSVEKARHDFHARYDVIGKTYKYFVYTGRRDPFKESYYTHYPYRIDIDQVKEAAKHFVGTHDFTSFCSVKTAKENKVRTIYTLDVEELGEEIVFTFTGNGFLYNMVRIIVGTIFQVGSGKLAHSEIPNIFAACDRKHIGKTAPAEGLHLWEVYYS